VLNFSYDERRAREFHTTGLDELADRLDASANLPWISTHVYRTAPMVANLRFGHHYAYSMLPHVATLLVAIGERGGCTFSDERIVDGDIFIASEWSLVSLSLPGAARSSAVPRGPRAARRQAPGHAPRAQHRLPAPRVRAAGSVSGA